MQTPSRVFSSSFESSSLASIAIIVGGNNFAVNVYINETRTKKEKRVEGVRRVETRAFFSNNSSKNGVRRDVSISVERKEPAAGVGSRGRTSKLTRPRGIPLVWHQSSFSTVALTPLSLSLSLYISILRKRETERDERRRRERKLVSPACFDVRTAVFTIFNSSSFFFISTMQNGAEPF